MAVNPFPRLQCTGDSCAWCGAKEVRPRETLPAIQRSQADAVFAPGTEVVTSKAGRVVAKVEVQGSPSGDPKTPESPSGYTGTVNIRVIGVP